MVKKKKKNGRNVSDNGAGRPGELPPAGTVFRQPLRAELKNNVHPRRTLAHWLCPYADVPRMHVLWLSSDSLSRSLSIFLF